MSNNNNNINNNNNKNNINSNCNCNSSNKYKNNCNMTEKLFWSDGCMFSQGGERSKVKVLLGALYPKSH